MSPILVRPVREQLEHDRVIRQLQAKYKRKFEVAINIGSDQSSPVGVAPALWYPDLVLQSTDKTHKLQGTVEVETAESINNLEAMSQWAAFSRQGVPFHLYVPAANVDSARRLCNDLQIAVAEIWIYHAMGDQMRFTLVHKSAQAIEPKVESKPEPKSEPKAESKAEPKAKPEPKAKAVVAAEPAARTRPASAPRAASSAARPATSAPRPTAAPARPAARPATARPARAARPAAAVPTRRNGSAATVTRKTAKAEPATRRAAAKPAARKAAAAPSRPQKRR